MNKIPTISFAVLVVGLLLMFGNAWANDDDVPLSLTIVAEAGETGIFRYTSERYQLPDSAPGGPATAVATGFELSFVGEILPPLRERIRVTLDLELTLLEDSGSGPPVARVFTVSKTFEVADNQTILIPATGTGPAIFATPRILAVGDLVQLKVVVPIGGDELALPDQRVLRNVRLAGAEGSTNSIREAEGQSFVTGVANDEAIITSLETGTELAATTRLGRDDIRLGVDLRFDLTDDSATTTVFGASGWQALQLPVQRSFQLETAASAADGQTIALAGLVAGTSSSAVKTELLVFVTPRLVESAAPAGAAQVLLEARVALAAGRDEVVEADGAQENQQDLLLVESRVPESRTGICAHSTKRSYVVGYPGGEMATSFEEAETSLVFTPLVVRGIPGGTLRVAWQKFVGEAPRFPFATASGEKWIELPQTRKFALRTDFFAENGRTLAIAGALSERTLPESSSASEILALVTPTAQDDGAVLLDTRLALVSTHTSKDPGDDVEKAVEDGLVCQDIDFSQLLTGQVQALIDDVLASGLPDGLLAALNASLTTALNLLADGNTGNDAAAAKQLQAFIQKVSGQSGNQIDPADANDFIAAAQAVIDRL